MEDYQKRVIKEKKKLDVKINKLVKCLCVAPNNLMIKEFNLLNRQYEIMQKYSKILELRIKFFDKVKNKI